MCVCLKGEDALLDIQFQQSSAFSSFMSSQIRVHQLKLNMTGLPGSESRRGGVTGCEKLKEKKGTTTVNRACVCAGGLQVVCLCG